MYGKIKGTRLVLYKIQKETGDKDVNGKKD